MQIPGTGRTSIGRWSVALRSVPSRPGLDWMPATSSVTRQTSPLPRLKSQMYSEQEKTKPFRPAAEIRTHCDEGTGSSSRDGLRCPVTDDIGQRSCRDEQAQNHTNYVRITAVGRGILKNQDCTNNYCIDGWIWNEIGDVPDGPCPDCSGATVTTDPLPTPRGFWKRFSIRKS